MKYNFDEIIDRSNNYAVKYDETKEKFGRDDLIPLWIADMDFQSCRPYNKCPSRKSNARYIWIYF